MDGIYLLRSPRLHICSFIFLAANNMVYATY